MSLDQSQDTGVEVPRMPLIIWGILVAVAGFFLLTRPAITAIAWVEIMAITWLIGGIFELIQALTDRGRYWGWRVISAILSVVAGIYIIGNPVIGTLFTVQVAFIFFAISALMDSIISILRGLKAQGNERWMSIILGIIQGIVGVWLLLHPIAGMLALVTVLGVMMVVGGIIIIIGAINMK